ncbi:MAG TPA: phosphopantothenate/pantothenate synthetase [Methanolinea sp.]|jgi:4-phosphopantoate--beta-alanine ligase|nr:MAG: Pantothenate synthetase [Methanoregulaceae archaeon PtaB.Bin009]OPY40891.1 MAG: Pantothenate synthetase [Methanoregulaceae archaeon PtaU1.Bin066]HII75502.1 phosphopantothenate/pantothenate synthetase [Methanolinea sp.]HNQ30761.1 4-phosphopantoate--beta-alanine ligase [Methanolinea sp.]
MIPPEHPRYRSLFARERLARYAAEGIVSLEGLSAHGRGEAFDYLLGEKTTASALLAEKTAAALLLTARDPVISVNGNTAGLAAELIAPLQEKSGAKVEVNLFHRTEERIKKISRLLRDHGVRLEEGNAERLLPLSHDRALCQRGGIYQADVILVPLEDGDRCQALREMGKTVIAIDLNPLSRTARSASLTIVDELTRALPNLTSFCASLPRHEAEALAGSLDNTRFLADALEMMKEGLSHAMD